MNPFQRAASKETTGSAKVLSWQPECWAALLIILHYYISKFEFRPLWPLILTWQQFCCICISKEIWHIKTHHWESTNDKTALHHVTKCTQAEGAEMKTNLANKTWKKNLRKNNHSLNKMSQNLEITAADGDEEEVDLNTSSDNRNCAHTEKRVSHLVFCFQFRRKFWQ